MTTSSLWHRGRPSQSDINTTLMYRNNNLTATFTQYLKHQRDMPHSCAAQCSFSGRFAHWSKSVQRQYHKVHYVPPRAFLWRGQMLAEAFLGAVFFGAKDITTSVIPRQAQILVCAITCALSTVKRVAAFCTNISGRRVCTSGSEKR